MSTPLVLPPAFPARHARWKWRVGGGLVFVAMAAGGYAVYARSQDGSTPVATPQTTQVRTGNLVTTLSASGSAASVNSLDLTFGTTGKVLSVSVGAGDHVAIGQEIARLDPTTAERKVESTSSQLTVAESKLADLSKPPSASDVASAEQSIASATASLRKAQEALTDAQDGPSADELTDAEAKITQSETAVKNAHRSVSDAEGRLETQTRAVDTAYANLRSAQRSYCSTSGIVVYACSVSDLPLDTAAVKSLNAALARTSSNEVTTETNALIKTNDAYLQALESVDSAMQDIDDAKDSVATAEEAVADAEQAKADLYLPPDAGTLEDLQLAVTSAEASLLAAQTRLSELYEPPSASEVTSAQQSLTDAQNNYDDALAAIDDLVLTAPFEGDIGEMNLTAGQSTPNGAAVTLTDLEHMQVGLSVSESDLPSLTVGQWALVTFEAIEGYQYIARIQSVSRTPTVSSGVTTYAVTAVILTAAEIQANQAEVLQNFAILATAGSGLSSAVTPGGGTGGFLGGGGFPPNGIGATPPAGGGGFPPNGTGATPPAGNRQGAGLQRLLEAPLPSPGMSASVTILVEVVENQLLVPSGAVKRDGATVYVNVEADDGSVERRTVTVGQSDATNTAILSGLTEGETVQTGSVVSAASAATTTAGANGGGGFPGGGALGGPTGNTVR